MDQLLNIRTPEHIELQYKLAGIGNRFLAFALDTLILAGILIGLWTAAGLVMGYLPKVNWELMTVALGVILSFVIYYGYFLIFETIWNGQTPGKRVLHLRVIREDGRPITFYEALIRNLMRTIDSFPPFFYAVGSASIFFSANAKRLGDYVAGTVVIREYAGEAPRRLAAELLTPLPAADGPIDLTKLSPDELDWVANFLRRRTALDAATRARMARRLTHALLPKLGVEAPVDPEPFLERLYDAYQTHSKFLS